MAKRLSDDGVPVTVPSALPKKGRGLFRGLSPNKKKAGDTVEVPDDPPTRPAREIDFGSNALPHFDSGDEPRTKIFVGTPAPPSSHHQKPDGAPSPVSVPSAMDDPVVGWLVIIEGPGQGTSLNLGSGQNSIGRGPDSRVKIDFGDDQISRSGHAVVIFDPKHNMFHVKQGDGVNLVYLNGEPVLTVTPLPSGSVLEMGASKLRFVAFCDDRFSW